MTCLAGYATTVSLFPGLDSFAAIAVDRFFDGAFSVGIWVSCETILLARAERGQKAYVTTLYAMAVAVGYVVGPLAAKAIFRAASMPAAFLVSGAIAALSTLIVLFGLDPDGPEMAGEAPGQVSLRPPGAGPQRDHTPSALALQGVVTAPAAQGVERAVRSLRGRGDAPASRRRCGRRSSCSRSSTRRTIRRRGAGVAGRAAEGSLGGGADQDMVAERRPGSRCYDSPMSRAVLAPAVATALARFRAAVDVRFGARVREVVLFGSHARGTASERSDVDVYVVIDDAAHEDRKTVFDIAYQIDASAPGEDGWVGLEPIVHSTAEAADMRSRERGLLRNIDSQGVRL